MSLPDDKVVRSSQTADSSSRKSNPFSSLLERRGDLQSLPGASALFELIFQSIPNGITLYDYKGNIVYANKVGALFYGFSSPEELLALDSIVEIRKRFLERFTIADESGNPFTPGKSPVERVLKGEDNAEAIFHCFDKPTKIEFWALTHANALYDEHHKLAIVIDTITNITSQKRAEAERRKNEERLRLMAESMPQKIFTARPNGDIDYFNQQWMDYTGLAFEQIQGWGWTQLIHPDDVEENVRRWQHSLDTGEPFQFEHRFRLANGDYRWHLSRALPMRDEHGSITMWIGSNTDIHEQKMAIVMRDDFVSMASHELKTPLTSLQGFSHLLKRLFIKNDDTQALAYLAKIEKQVNKLTVLITDLLDLSQMVRGKLEYHEESFDLFALAQEIVENVQGTSTTHRLRLQGSGAPVFGDKDRIGQVLENLLTNAIKYSPRAREVLVRVSHDAQEARASVQDFGIGIKSEYQQHVFERFYRVTDPTAQTFPGLGIGLYVCGEIIRRHHGAFQVQSEQEKGSIFSFTLPLVSQET